MRPFVYQTHPQRIVFRAGALATLGAEADTLHARKLLVLCTPQQRDLAERAAEVLGARCAGIFDGAVMHVPVEQARLARSRAAELGADAVVAIGGGSTIGLGKAIALESELPIVAVPTTYAGSEMTPIYGLTEGGLKRTGRDPRVLPRTVVYDPDLTLGLPVAMSVTSGINAIAHAAEGLYAGDRTPVSDWMCREGIAAMGRALPVIAASGGERDGTELRAELRAARSDALYGAWLCGAVLGSATVGLHHKLCHTLGGSYNLPHAETHTIVLPHALAYNAPAAPRAMAAIAAALGRPDATGPQAVFDLAASLGAAVALRDIGLREEDLDRACELALQAQYPNPRPLEAKALRQLLQNAFDGALPAP
ncbi:maleylacetate reductase [Cupriavidus taiwanensis]|uniref:maleylacetate reductase n=1 Tax=Cupriavidus taiwanensis TaxID=164546 RepID=UPI000E106014|nr:maleylacetate reductase [Cupriavidus taiwanensis]SOY67253.1 Maleylacetate reductase [Cupriavidus taiwanensis]SOY67513.1 Maleylacetate reductase [Cupriavidus taiwanensis]SOY94873.1 Maleylacetate reductase [Cupriavidus taiwanensis]SOZ71822.1 Maleylacetate reductase [Cupriavidus taiwanensis]SOZ87123.1 Maleylacetate reductase [Cupriavidus taiwanensis]